VFSYQGDTVTSEVATTGTTVVTRTFTTDEAGAIIKVAVATTPTAGADDGTYLVTWNGHGDALGLAEINADGTLTAAATITYSTWGAPNITAEPGYGPLGFRYLYVGRFDVQWDNFGGAGLQYMHARHYSSEFGRFLQPDPSRAEPNFYAYANGSPVSRVDPLGSESWLPNLYELEHCDSYPVQCRVWLKASAFAIAIAKPIQNVWKENAYRHCIWQCVLTARLGRLRAGRWAWLHEQYSGSSSTDKTIDYHNNYVGRLFGQQLRGFPWPEGFAYYFCDEAWKRGWLLTYDRLNRVVRWSDGRRY
jgi:RHS repeat-associated protein